MIEPKISLYDLHSNPYELYNYEYRGEVPHIAYEFFIDNPYMRKTLEPHIAKHAETAYYYALKQKGANRWPEAEPVIMKDPEYAYLYASHILKRPWPAAEPYIMKAPYWAYSYAYDINLKNREPWPEAEPYIMKDPLSAYHYSLDILKRPWPEAEPYIMKDDYFAGQYRYYWASAKVDWKKDWGY